MNSSIDISACTGIDFIVLGARSPACCGTTMRRCNSVLCRRLTWLPDWWWT